MASRIIAARRAPGDREAGFHPPIPREHGAWVMLYGPLLLGLIAAANRAPLAALLLFAAFRRRAP